MDFDLSGTGATTALSIRGANALTPRLSLQVGATLSGWAASAGSCRSVQFGEAPSLTNRAMQGAGCVIHVTEIEPCSSSGWDEQQAAYGLPNGGSDLLDKNRPESDDSPL
jgi:hypothetical protein